MKDLGIYLILLSIPFFILYLVCILFLYPEGHNQINFHVLAITHVLNAMNVYFLWSKFFDVEEVEGVLDEDLIYSSFQKKKNVHPILPAFLFPLGFLISIGSLTYMLMYIMDHNHQGFSHWFGEELLVTFILACSIPASLISVPFYFRLLNKGVTQSQR